MRQDNLAQSLDLFLGRGHLAYFGQLEYCFPAYCAANLTAAARMMEQDHYQNRFVLTLLM